VHGADSLRTNAATVARRRSDEEVVMLQPRSYEETRSAHLAYASERVPEYVARLGWSRAEIEKEQGRALRDLLRHAMQHAPWHRRRLRQLELDRITPARIAELPSMTKQDLMENWDAIVTEPGCTLAEAESHLAGLRSDAYLRGDLHVIASGGSSGMRGVFLYGWHGWAAGYVALTRALRAELMRMDPPRRGPLVSVAAHVATHATSALSETFSNPQQPTIQAPVTWPLAQIVATLNEAQPTVLIAYASMLAVLAAEARAGRLRIAPALIYSTSEPLFPEIREAAEAVWGACVRNMFATSESIGVAFPCPSGAGFHIGEDLNIIELVDEDGRPVAPGERSARILLTNLYNTSLPLLRYEIGDELELAKDPCACGSAYLKVSDAQGRADDVFRYAGDVCVHPLNFRSPLGRRSEIVEYQVRQTERGADIDVRTRSEIDLDALRSEIEQRLTSLGLASPAVQLRRVDDALTRQGSGKLKRFVPLVR
jgi:phenylacetate-CoA ligase